MLIALAILLVAIGAGILRLASGPVPIPFLVNWVSNNIDTSSIDVQIGDAQLDLSSFGNGAVLLENAVVSVKGRSSAEVLVPRIRLGVNFSALLLGRLEVQTVSFERPSAKIKISAGTKPLPKVQNQVVAIDKFSVILGQELKNWNLETIDVRNGALTIQTGLEIFRAYGVDAKLSLMDEVNFGINASIAGRLGRWNWSMRREVVPETGDRHISIDIADVTVMDVLPDSSKLEYNSVSHTRLSSSAFARLDAPGNFVDARLNVRTSPIKATLKESTLEIDEVALNLYLNRGDPDIVVERSYVSRGNTRVVFGGLLTPPATDDDTWHYALGSREAAFGPNDVDAQPVVFLDAYARGRVDLKDQTIYLDKARAQGLSADINAAGSFTLAPEGPMLALVIQSPRLNANQVKQLWPVTAIGKVRSWVVDHVLGGFATHIDLAFALGPKAFDGDKSTPAFSGNDLTASFDLHNIAVHPLSTLPIATQLSGRGVIADETLTLIGEDGQFRLQDGNVVDITKVDFHIYDLPVAKVKPADVNITVKGRADDLGVLVDAKPFSALERLDVLPGQLSGQGELTVTADFPIGLRKIPADQVAWSAVLQTDDFTSAAQIAGQKIEDADLLVTANNKVVTAKGTGLLNGLKADIDISQPLDGSSAQKHQDVMFEADPQELLELGVDLTDFVTGTMRVGFEEKDGVRSYSMDLTKASVNISQIGWKKGKGIPATARFRMSKSAEGVTIHNLSLKSEGVDIRGNLRVDTTGSLNFADFSRFNLRPADNAELSIKHQPDGSYRVDFDAKRFDGRAMLRAMSPTEHPNQKRDFGVDVLVNVNAEQLIGYGGMSAFGVDGTAKMKKGKLTSLQFTGSTAQKNAFTVNLAPNGDGRRLSANAADVGEVLRFLKMFKRMRGGRGWGHIDISASDEWTGTVTVKDFSIVDDSAIRALKGIRRKPAGSARDAAVYSAAVSSGEASFQKMQVQFRRNKDLITIDEGLLAGNILGGSFAGGVNLNAETVDITGTFVPIYAINNLFAKLPIIGKALGGGSSSGGLFGVTYKLEGKLSDPQFVVNPVSVIAPGIFRRMFEFQ
ncbi:hypothetical protein E1162_08440 [Rhodobacteraceae bacterium RKSG542]|uniref:AsmA-like C-terminal region-containing protein n=1 Tax=Pseudovibrio flavus TaxID=2529854 RepID=UPI0012BCFD81|nr:AsmA-like C-terminal region-containing protein [Pseudovibrio flavus]MTI17270.1 hypothetical protein [Pseudovibrio flavus]